METIRRLGELKHCGELHLQHIDDGVDGSLTIAESLRAIPFSIQRVYYITRLSNPEAVRGKHAHKTLEQAIFCINGAFELELDDGIVQTSVVLDRPDYGIYLGPQLWHVMKRFSPDCVILVFASALYDEDDYLRNYADFLAYITQDGALVAAPEVFTQREKDLIPHAQHNFGD